LLEAWIGECGFECIVSCCAEDAWKSIILSIPKLIVTDIEMPGASGLELLYALRRHPSSAIRSIPAIVVSSLEDSDIQKFVYDAGGTFFLPKPLGKESVQRVVFGLPDLVSDRDEVFFTNLDEIDDSSIKISPTLRRLYRELAMHGTRFK